MGSRQRALAEEYRPDLIITRWARRCKWGGFFLLNHRSKGRPSARSSPLCLPPIEAWRDLFEGRDVECSEERLLVYSESGKCCFTSGSNITAPFLVPLPSHLFRRKFLTWIHLLLFLKHSLIASPSVSASTINSGQHHPRAKRYQCLPKHTLWF